MSFFSKKLSELTFEDVEKLVENQVPESEILDYKRQMPSNEDMAKLVSAFANTYGGYILIGISEKDDTNRPEKIVGKAKDIESLDDRIDSICMDRIDPPVVVETKSLCSSNRKDARGVLVIKVPESDLTPHAVDHNTTVYFKVKAQKRKIARDGYEKADLPNIARLENRRAKITELREMRLKLYDEVREQVMSPVQREEYLIMVKTIPLYPRGPLLRLDEIHGVARRVHQESRWAREFLDLPSDFGTTDQGICFYAGQSDDVRQDIRYDAMFDCFGQCSASFVQKMTVDEASGTRYLSLDNPARIPQDIIDLGMRYVNSINYLGSVVCEIRVENLRNSWLYRNVVNLGKLNTPNLENRLTDQIVVRRTLPHLHWEREIETLMKEYYSKLLFAYGITEGLVGYSDTLFTKWATKEQPSAV